MPEKGYFVITDITGYTAFLTGSELDHAQDILKTLFETQLETIKPPLLVSNFQGDAILSYAPEGSFLHGDTLMDTVENIYCAFAHQLEIMRLNTTCTCRACANIPNLDLKIFVHYGEYVIHDLRGRTELSGPDVILTHRMMKNKVTAQTGYKAYALLTDAALDRMGLGEFSDAMKPHSESYEHIGEVTMYVYGLREMWEQEREKRRVTVDPKGAWFKVEADLPASPALIWEYFTDSERRRRSLGIQGMTVSGIKRGRKGVGTTFHCIHGAAETTDFIVLDWRPFEYLTEEVRGLPFRMLGRYTLHLIPTATGTHAEMIFAKMTGTTGFGKFIAPLLHPIFGRMLRRDFRRAFETMQEILEEDRAAGTIRAAPSAVLAPSF